MIIAGQTFPLATQVVWSGPAADVSIQGGYCATNASPLPGERDPKRWPTILQMTTTNQPVISIRNVTNGVLEGVTITGERQCVLRSTTTNGGGVYAFQCANLTLASCIITNNWIQELADAYGTSAYGGGLYARKTRS